MIIDTHYFFQRIGEDNERPNDRRFCSKMMLWKWKADWNAAMKDGDYRKMDDLDREYERCFCL